MKDAQREVFDISILFVLGLAVRIFAPLSASFPLNDGGLFYQMTIDLQKNHFLIPSVTAYNSANLPFAYPPLAFYLYGFINQITGISLLNLIRLLPAIISACTIPVFYLLAKDLLNIKAQAMFAALGFAFVPRSFDWLIMGGGMTRSLGFLFAILSIRQANLLISKPSNKNLIQTAFLCGATLLTHPEASVHTFISIAFLYLWRGRSLKSAIHVALFGAGASIIAAPWLMRIMSLHGITPFYAALTSAGGDSPALIVRILSLFKFQFTDEPFLQFNSVIGLIGLFILISQRRPALALWLAAILLIEPRGGTLYAILPLGMAFGVALDKIISLFSSSQCANGKNRVVYSFCGLVFLYGLLNAFIVTSDISRRLTLTDTDLRAFEWVNKHTSTQAQFALITSGHPFNDATSEWFPVLAQRISLATTFGYEWTSDRELAGRIQSYDSLQKCALEGEACLRQWEAKTEGLNYIYIRESNKPSLLTEQLKLASDYTLIYETETITIFQKK